MIEIPKNLLTDVNRIAETSRERSRSPPLSRGVLSRLAPHSQSLADTCKESAQAEREVVPAAANRADSRRDDATMSGPYLCRLAAWSLGIGWSAKSSFLSPSFDHTYYAGSGWMSVCTLSMKDVHFVAFCKFFGLPYEKP